MTGKPTPGRFVSPEPVPTAAEIELLTVLSEECSEVIQRAAKAVRFGLTEVQPGQGLSNSERVASEVGDVVAVVAVCFEAGLIDKPTVAAARRAKFEKLGRYLQSPENQALLDRLTKKGGNDAS